MSKTLHYAPTGLFKDDLYRDFSVKTLIKYVTLSSCASTVPIQSYSSKVTHDGEMKNAPNTKGTGEKSPVSYHSRLGHDKTTGKPFKFEHVALLLVNL